MRSGTPYELDVEMFSNGGRRWVTARGEAMRDADGRITGLRGTVQDITARKRAEEMLSNQSRRLLEAQEAERARIARELHDDIGQRLALLSIALEQLQQSADPASELHRSIAALSRQTVDIATDVQALSHELHSSKLQLLGVVPAIRDFCSEVSARQKVEVDFTHQDVPGTVRPDIALCLFRVLQEALQNAVRHSAAARFAVSLEGTPKALTLTVRDGGRGFNPESVPRDRGLGLTSMRERLKLVAGELVIDSKPDSGTTVVARVPLQDALVALRQRHLRRRGPRLAAEVLQVAATATPVCGTSIVPISRNMCGRSFGSRPFALVRLFGSRPNVAVGKAGATVLTCGVGGARAARCLQAVGPGERVGAERLPAVGPALFQHHHEAVVRQRVVRRGWSAGTADWQSGW